MMLILVFALAKGLTVWQVAIVGALGGIALLIKQNLGLYLLAAAALWLVADGLYFPVRLPTKARERLF